MPQQNGQFKQDDYYNNTGGINLSDSPFKVAENQATGGSNYTYELHGGIRKRRGHLKTSAGADTQLRTLGLGLSNTSAGVKTLIRGAGTKLQAVEPSTGAFTDLSNDTSVAGTDILAVGSEQPVVFSQFNTAASNVLWSAGGGMSTLNGVYSGTKVTSNGVDAPVGAITATPSATGGTFVTTGVFRYAVALRKASTQALSNASFSQTATVSATSDKVTIDLSGITGVDTTRFDKFYIYRSAVGGAADFTTGDLIAQINTTVLSFVDTGVYITTAGNIARPNNLLLDNGVLPSGTYKTLAVFKRRLVTASNSTVYFSDLNKPESWPGGNEITIPSGGPITGLAVIPLTSSGSDSIEEILVIFKERELWVITGTNISDWVLKFIDASGCSTQSLIVVANGFSFWVDQRGVYLWEGYGKPIYCSRPIEPMFESDGDLDTTKLNIGVGQFSRKQNSIIWNLSHKIYGEQRLQLILDLKLTLPGAENALVGRILDGIFVMQNTSFPVYGALSYLPTNSTESLLFGDAAGFLWGAYTGDADDGAAFSMTYATKLFDQGNPNIDKRYNYVIVWVEEIGDWNLTLDWWTDFKQSQSTKSTRALPISEAEVAGTALWDIAFWDVAMWDDYVSKLRPLMFQLVSDTQNNSEGKALKLQFRQEGANQPVTIAGFSVLYSEKGMSRPK